MSSRDLEHPKTRDLAEQGSFHNLNEETLPAARSRLQRLRRLEREAKRVKHMRPLVLDEQTPRFVTLRDGIGKYKGLGHGTFFYFYSLQYLIFVLLALSLICLVPLIANCTGGGLSDFPHLPFWLRTTVINCPLLFTLSSQPLALRNSSQALPENATYIEFDYKSALLSRPALPNFTTGFLKFKQAVVFNTNNAYAASAASAGSYCRDGGSTVSLDSKCERTILVRVMVASSSLSNSRLEGANATSAKVADSSLLNATAGESTLLAASRAEQSSFFRANATSCYLNYTIIEESSAQTSDLRESTLTYSAFSNAQVFASRIDNSETTRSLAYAASVYDSNVTDSTLDSSFVGDSSLTDTTAVSSNLQGTASTSDKLFSAKVADSISKGSTVISSQLRKAVLESSFVFGATLVYADLSGSAVFNSRVDTSTLNATRLQFSSVSDSVLVNCVVLNSTLYNVELRNQVVFNNQRVKTNGESVSQLVRRLLKEDELQDVVGVAPVIEEKGELGRGRRLEQTVYYTPWTYNIDQYFKYLEAWKLQNPSAPTTVATTVSGASSGTSTLVTPMMTMPIVIGTNKAADGSVNAVVTVPGTGPVDLTLTSVVDKTVTSNSLPVLATVTPTGTTLTIGAITGLPSTATTTTTPVNTGGGATTTIPNSTTTNTPTTTPTTTTTTIPTTTPTTNQTTTTTTPNPTTTTTTNPTTTTTTNPTTTTATNQTATTTPTTTTTTTATIPTTTTTTPNPITTNPITTNPTTTTTTIPATAATTIPTTTTPTNPTTTTTTTPTTTTTSTNPTTTTTTTATVPTTTTATIPTNPTTTIPTTTTTTTTIPTNPTTTTTTTTVPTTATTTTIPTTTTTTIPTTTTTGTTTTTTLAKNTTATSTSTSTGAPTTTTGTTTTTANPLPATTNSTSTNTTTGQTTNTTSTPTANSTNATVSKAFNSSTMQTESSLLGNTYIASTTLPSIASTTTTPVKYQYNPATLPAFAYNVRVPVLSDFTDSDGSGDLPPTNSKSTKLSTSLPSQSKSYDLDSKSSQTTTTTETGDPFSNIVLYYDGDALVDTVAEFDLKIESYNDDIDYGTNKVYFYISLTCDIAICCVFFVAIVAFRICMVRQVAQVERATPSIAKFSVVLGDLPTKGASVEQIEGVLSGLTTAKPKRIDFAFALEGVLKCALKRMRLETKLLGLEDKTKMTEYRKWQKSVKYGEKLTRLNRKLEKRAGGSGLDFKKLDGQFRKVCAYAVFENSGEPAKICNRLSEIQKAKNSAGAKINGKPISIGLASDVYDLNFQHLGIRRRVKVLKILAFSLCTAMLLVANAYLCMLIESKIESSLAKVDCPSNSTPSKPKASARYEVKYCYCNANVDKILDQDYRRTCGSFLYTDNSAYYAPFVIVIVITAFNMIIEWVVESMFDWVKFERYSKQASMKVVVLFLLEFLNILGGLLITTGSGGRGDDNPKFEAIAVSFKLVSPDFYVKTGSKVIMLNFFGMFLPHVINLVRGFAKLWLAKRRKAKHELHPEEKLHNTKPEEFHLEGHSVAVLTTLATALTFSSIMPVLVLFAAASLICAFFTNRFLLVRLSHRPPFFTDDLVNNFFALLPLMLVCHLVFSVSVFGDWTIFLDSRGKGFWKSFLQSNETPDFATDLQYRADKNVILLVVCCILLVAMITFEVVLRVAFYRRMVDQVAREIGGPENLEDCRELLTANSSIGYDFLLLPKFAGLVDVNDEEALDAGKDNQQSELNVSEGRRQTSMIFTSDDPEAIPFRRPVAKNSQAEINKTKNETSHSIPFNKSQFAKKRRNTGESFVREAKGPAQDTTLPSEINDNDSLIQLSSINKAPRVSEPLIVFDSIKNVPRVSEPLISFDSIKSASNLNAGTRVSTLKNQLEPESIQEAANEQDYDSSGSKDSGAGSEGRVTADSLEEKRRFIS